MASRLSCSIRCLLDSKPSAVCYLYAFGDWIFSWTDLWIGIISSTYHRFVWPELSRFASSYRLLILSHGFGFDLDSFFGFDLDLIWISFFFFDFRWIFSRFEPLNANFLDIDGNTQARNSFVLPGDHLDPRLHLIWSLSLYLFGFRRSSIFLTSSFVLDLFFRVLLYRILETW